MTRGLFGEIATSTPVMVKDALSLVAGVDGEPEMTGLATWNVNRCVNDAGTDPGGIVTQMKTSAVRPPERMRFSESSGRAPRRRMAASSDAPSKS
jgi:hypothetical protein